MRTPVRAVLLILGLSVAAVQASGAERHTGTGTLELSSGLLDLLRAEMVEVANGMQGLVVALAAADWPTVAGISARIRASDLMAQKLTPEQGTELERALPERFRQLDAEFHGRAAKLEAAALARDGELALFHYSRLIESCVACHSAYAMNRFPGLGVAVEPAHHHH